MAIEIIPKKTESRSVTLIGTIFYLSLILLLAIVLISLLLLGLQLSLKKSISNTETKINSVATTEDLSLEKKVVLAQQRVDDFAFLLNNHYSGERFFANFEELVHPQTFFSEIDLQIEKGQAKLFGTAENFEVLGQQTLIFEKENYIKSADLLETSIEKDGKITFTIRVIFNAGEFRY